MACKVGENMSKTDDLRKMITEVVEMNQGMKMIELITYLVVKLANDERMINSDVILAIIENMEKKKELVVINYVLPQMNYRLKMFILPKGTQIDVPSIVEVGGVV